MKPNSHPGEPLTRLVTAGLRLLLPLVILAPALCAQAPRIGVDTRIELMSIIFKLAGAEEYNQGRIPTYEAAIRSHFAPFGDHEAVRIARELRQKDSVGFDAVMVMAIHLKDTQSLDEIVPFERNTAFDERWNATGARRFLAAARKFVVDSDFAGFVKSQQPFYDQTDTRLRAFIASNVDLGWFDRFFGPRKRTAFHLVPGLVNGGPSYGPHTILPSGEEEIYSIPGVWEIDAAGMPVFQSSWAATLIHEFSHSYLNPLVGQAGKRLASSGDRLFQATSGDMRRQTYGDGHSVLCESLVRAATARYEFEHHGAESGKLNVDGEVRIGFLWVPGLYDLLGQYAQQRDRYATLESFMPSIVDYFDRTASHIGDAVRAYEDRRPKVASLSVADGAEDVDPALKEITVRFDRPMDRNHIAIMNIGGVQSIQSGKAAFDDTGCILTFPVSLEPAKSYGFGLNWFGGDGFRAADGTPLRAVEIRFHTALPIAVPR